MAKYYGTKGNDTVVGAAEADLFFDFGIGHDVLTGGGKNDIFYLSVDDITDSVDGRDGLDTIDYSKADRAVRIDLTAGTVTATFHYHDDATVLVAQVQNVENATGSIYGDTIYGTDGRNTLDGNAGDDYLYGRDGNDTLIGGDGADHLYGGDLDDTLLGGLGNDYINGGYGTDTVSYADIDRGHAINANLSDGPLQLAAGMSGPAAHTVTISLGSGLTETDTVVGVENLTGTAYADWVEGGAAANVFDGGAGNDMLLGHDGSDTLIGGDGDDQLVGGRGGDDLRGGNGSDWAVYNLNELSYDDPGGPVRISLSDPSSNTWWAAGDTYDSIENIGGSPFDDIITGDNNNNIIRDDAGSNTFYGLGGMDTFVGNPHAGDRFYGGDQADTVDYSDPFATDLGAGISTVTVDLDHPSLNAGAAAGDTFVFVENIIGTRHDDTIAGNWENNILIGNDGDDHLEGRGWNDTLIGGDGDDTAIFSGNFADYQFTTINYVSNGQFGRYLEVHDTHADRDATDDLYGVEHLQFHNMTVGTASLMDPLFHL
jgi:Ca2+-binding RTX toxin-like protein